jgi:hypothetical protein
MSSRQRERRKLDVDPDVEKRLAELIDGDAWTMADYLAEAFPESEYPNLGKGRATGLGKELREYELALKKHHGIEIAANTMRAYRATALLWPNDTRVSFAPFTVHRYLHGPDRREEMAKRIRQAKAEGDDALSLRQLKRFRADEKPRQAKSMREVLRRRLATTTRGVLLEGINTDRDDWWNVRQVTPVQRAMASEELRRLADLIETRGGDDE